MTDFAAERATLALQLGRVRWASFAVGAGNVAVAAIGAYLTASEVISTCFGRGQRTVLAVSFIAAVRVVSMFRAGQAQKATAESIAGCGIGDDSSIRIEKQMRYRRWLWWTRIGIAVTILQFLSAVYLMFVVVNNLSDDGCIAGDISHNRRKYLRAIFLVVVWFVVVIQCFTGTDVLRWRSFYATHDAAWKAHYQEVFDHGIREVLCCLGRVKYMSVLEEDEVYSVARLLGDLVAYRASGTGHLELLAGLVLLQRHRRSQTTHMDLADAPEDCIEDASRFHRYAEAAYTGPLLDVGRSLVLFPCAWLYRQGVLTPWTRNRRPLLQGDNWWRGHAAAFLKCANLRPEALRCGRVSQTRREAAYFVVVLHDLKTIVIAVRGTETPEDLLTDGLCRECSLSSEDLDGLVNGNHFSEYARERVNSSFPHYGHSGIVESARELFMQIDGQPENGGGFGFLSSLLGVGCECHGYDVRIVGHSLGGAIAAMLGLRLYGRYPNLHVYAYGALPCVDSVVAEACSGFVTTIVYNDEFSARLSVNSILRLRAAAIAALSDSSSTDSAVMAKLARRILHANKSPRSAASTGGLPASFISAASSSTAADDNQLRFMVDGSDPHVHGPYRVDSSISDNSYDEISICAFRGYMDSEDSKDDISSCKDMTRTRSESSVALMDLADQAHCASGSDASVGASPEMFLPGLVVHIVPEKRESLSLRKYCRIYSRSHGCYNAVIADRESFRDIVVTPYMFLDHMPWRCEHALVRVLEGRKSCVQRPGGSPECFFGDMTANP